MPSSSLFFFFLFILFFSRACHRVQTQEKKEFREKRIEANRDRGKVGKKMLPLTECKRNEQILLACANNMLSFVAS
jgi:hypothetical protein